MAKKNVTYRVFVIKNEELTYDTTDLKDVLRTKLANSNVERRLIPVKEGDDSEKDLLGAFAPASNVEGAEYVYGVMMRLKPAKEFRALPDNFEQLVELPETDLLELQEIEGKTICSNLYHFMIRSKYLITDLSQIQTITGFQKYLSKLLVNRTYGFAPYLMRKDLKLKDVSTVTFKDSLRPTPQEEANMFSLKNIAKGAIKFISPGVKRLSEIIDSNMVSAHMVLNFERPKKMEPTHLKGHRLERDGEGYILTAHTAKNSFCQDMFYHCPKLRLVIVPLKASLDERSIVRQSHISYKDAYKPLIR